MGASHSIFRDGLGGILGMIMKGRYSCSPGRPQGRLRGAGGVVAPFRDAAIVLRLLPALLCASQPVLRSWLGGIIETMMGDRYLCSSGRPQRQWRGGGVVAPCLDAAVAFGLFLPPWAPPSLFFDVVRVVLLKRRWEVVKNALLTLRKGCFVVKTVSRHVRALKGKHLHGFT